VLRVSVGMLNDPAAWRLGALALAVGLAAGFGVVRRLRDGAALDVAAGWGQERLITASDIGRPLGVHATLLQISTQFCQPCGVARRVLGGLAADLPGVEHVEVDAQEHLDLVRRLDVTRTPTILVLDGHGRVAQRAHGVPSAQQIMTALSRHLPAEGPGPAHVG